MSRSVISIQNLIKTYKIGNDDVQVLKSINIEVEHGEFIALLGTSGSGKSTLLNIIGLLETPSSGKYFLDNKDVSNLTDTESSKIRNLTIGFIFQSFYLIPYLSVLENVMLPGMYSHMEAKELQARAENLLNQVSLSDRLQFKPNQLSGGQQQRVAIARALINEPQILLADEPSGQLDSNTSKEIMGILQNINDLGKTIILVTHDQNTASYAKKTKFLSDGQFDLARSKTNR